jgi:hypothetical protein
MKDHQPPAVMDVNSKRYSDAYDAATRGEPCPSTSGLDCEGRAATELGFDRGTANQKFISHVNRNDPSAEFLNRQYHKRYKWDFDAIDAQVKRMKDHQ